MANTYTQNHQHFIFAPKYRQALISENWKNDLYAYISGIVQGNGHKTIIINGMPDHVHIVIGMRPTQSISDLLQDIKSMSAKWINDKRLCPGKFEWQSGFAAFSYSKSHLEKLIDYVKHQEQHHKKKTFSQEYKDFLTAFEVEFDEKYLFKEPI